MFFIKKLRQSLLALATLGTLLSFTVSSFGADLNSFTYPNGDRFEGEAVNGNRTGKGIFTFASGARYEGDFVNNKFQGKGIYTYTNGDRYEGHFSNDKRMGKGIFFYKTGSRYDGDFVNDRRTGKGTYVYENGSRYEGDFLDDKLHGKGSLTASDGTRYEGDFVDNKRSGKGSYIFPNRDRYEGDVVDGKRTGKGVYTFVSGNRYEGDFVDDKRSGKGVYTFLDGDRYEGDFVDSSFQGKGIFTFANGDRYDGDFSAGKIEGYGTYKDKSGNIRTGTWQGGNLIKAVEKPLANTQNSVQPPTKAGENNPISVSFEVHINFPILKIVTTQEWSVWGEYEFINCENTTQHCVGKSITAPFVAGPIYPSSWITPDDYCKPYSFQPRIRWKYNKRENGKLVRVEGETLGPKFGPFLSPSKTDCNQSSDSNASNRALTSTSPATSTDYRPSASASTNTAPVASPSKPMSTATSNESCPTTGPLRMISATSEIPGICTKGRKNNYAYSDRSEAEGATAQAVCDIARKGDVVKRSGVRNVSICFCGKNVMKFQSIPQAMACWVLYDED